MLPGGDYGFPNNPIGRNARDLGLFVPLFGYSPLEALRAATYYGGLVLDLPVGLLTPGLPRRHPGGQRLARGRRHRAARTRTNLLAIMQGGRFHKRAGRLALATA